MHPGNLASAGPASAQRRKVSARLLDLVNLVALRGRPALTEHAQGVTATLLTLLAVSTWVVLSRWETGPDAVFYVYGIPHLAWYALGGLVVAWALARASVPRIALARAIAVSALGAWLVVLYFHFGGLVASRRLALVLSAGALLYALVYFVRAARALTGVLQPRAVLAAFVATLAFLGSTTALSVYPTVWVAREYEAEEYDRAFEQAEPLMFVQRERVDAAVASVEQSDPERTELYFVGFAGYSGQKVFAEEIKFASRVVGERYATGARTLLLLNDDRDVDAAPLATASTLGHALRGVAAKMTTDDDVLFLTLSSHGSRDWELRLTHGALPLADLTPEQLREALDESGIRWRVIVISACYAGGFVEALQDPHTIVVAAAAPNRASFGCRDERELTYFGEAFFRDALPNAVSLRDAFAAAERIVGEREAAEGFDVPSLPMASFGAELEPKLAGLETYP